MKKIFRLLIVFSFILISCNGYSLDSIPYVISGDFVMDEGSKEYSICGVDLYLFNKSEKEISSVNVVFFLFDKDGEPAVECSNKISAKIEQIVPGEEDCNFCLSLDRFMNSVPEEELLVDYLYLSKIEYEDGSCWEDPYGLAVFK